MVDAGPDNPLGERWIGLGLPGFGFHGTLSPTSVGSAASHGCMRMYSGSVRELFEKVQVGWPVRLEYETARLGTTADGTICAVVFPDVYSQKPSDTQLRRQLASSGLEEWVDEAVVNRLVNKPTGVVEPIVEGGVQLVLSNKLVAPTAGRPYLLKTKQGLMISTDALAKLGCQIEYDQASRLITAQRVVEVKAAAPKAPPVPETPVQDPVTPVNTTVPGVQTTPIPATPGVRSHPRAGATTGAHANSADLAFARQLPGWSLGQLRWRKLDSGLLGQRPILYASSSGLAVSGIRLSVGSQNQAVESLQSPLISLRV